MALELSQTLKTQEERDFNNALTEKGRGALV